MNLQEIIELLQRYQETLGVYADTNVEEIKIVPHPSFHHRTVFVVVHEDSDD